MVFCKLLRCVLFLPVTVIMLLLLIFLDAAIILNKA